MDKTAKKIILPTILFIAVFIFSFFALTGKNSANPLTDEPIDQDGQASEIILFYGDTCPHCKIVEDYIKENQIDEKIIFSQKEVYHNTKNAAELTEKAKICGLPTSSIGVPFLWDGENCLVGDQDIISFFKQKTGQ